jgi:lysophospholipase L1-like esterase
MRGPRRALLAGAAALAVAVISAGCGSDDNSPPPNQGTAIVSIGDSVASGEGNPAPSGPRWENRACHRSATAGQTIAAREEQKQHPEIGFLNYACSGASIEKGLLKPYKGIEPAPFRPGQAQIDEVRDAAARAHGSGGLAAVMISIGANDVGFSSAVKFCDLVRRCWEKHFNPDLPFVQASARFPTLEDYVNARLAELPERFDRLAAALDPLVPAERVIVVDYFDSTTAADGSDCTMLFGGVTPDESRWAREHMLQPLNARVEAAADEHDWQVVTGVAERFRGHGLCAGRQRWVRTLGEGLSGRPLPLGLGGVGFIHIRDLIESTAGTLHPNEEGHRQIAAPISPVLAEVLNP